MEKITSLNVNENCPNGVSNTRSDTYLNCNRSVCIDYLKVRFNRVILPYSDEFYKLLTLLKVEPSFVTSENCQWDGYKNCFTLGSDIQFMYGGVFTESNGNETSVLQLKGSACRGLDDRFIRNDIDIYDGWRVLIEFCITIGCKFKRIDTPLDYYGLDINFDNLLDKIYKKIYISSFKNPPEIIKSNGISITFGKYSARTLCIYDKKQERKFKDYEISLNNWIRFEPRFKDENADDYALKLLKALIEKDLGKLVCGALKGLLDIKSKNNYDENNLYKADTWDKWDKLLENNKAIKITRYIDKTSTLLKKYTWYSRSVTKARMMIEIAYPEYSEELFGICNYRHIEKLTPKDIALINEDRIKNGFNEIKCEDGLKRASELYSKYKKVDPKVLEISGLINDNGEVNFDKCTFDRNKVKEIVSLSLEKLYKDKKN